MGFLARAICFFLASRDAPAVTLAVTRGASALLEENKLVINFLIIVDIVGSHYGSLGSHHCVANNSKIGQWRANAISRKRTSGLHATGKVTCSNKGKSLMESE